MNVHRTAAVLRSPVSYGGAGLFGLIGGLIVFMFVLAWLAVKYTGLSLYWVLRLTAYELPRAIARLTR